MFFYYSNNPYFPQNTVTAIVGASLFGFSLLLLMLFTTLQFYYRFGIIVKNKSYSTRWFLIASGILFLYSIGSQFVFSFFTRSSNEEFDQILKQNGDDLQFYVAIDLRELDIIWVCICNIQIMSCEKYFLDIFLGFKVWNFLKTKAGNMSPKTIQAQKRLTTVLFAQVS